MSGYEITRDYRIGRESYLERPVRAGDSYASGHSNGEFRRDYPIQRQQQMPYDSAEKRMKTIPLREISVKSETGGRRI